MKIKIFKRVIRYTFDKFQKDQQKAWQLLDQLDPFYKEPLSPNNNNIQRSIFIDIYC